MTPHRPQPAARPARAASARRIHPAIILSYEGIFLPERDTGLTPAASPPAPTAESAHMTRPSISPISIRRPRLDEVHLVPAPLAPLARSPRVARLAHAPQAAAPSDVVNPAEQACRRAWRLLRAPAVDSLVAAATPPLRRAPELAAALQDAFNAGRVPGVLIEQELRRALRDGVSDATLLALTLLAAVALDRFHGGARATALAQACAERARQPDAAGVAGAVLGVHAALVLARSAPLRDVALLHAEACRAQTIHVELAGAAALARPDTLARNAVLWSGMRLLGGAPLAELLHYLDAVHAALPPVLGSNAAPAAASTARVQLDGRIALLRALADSGAQTEHGAKHDVSTPAADGTDSASGAARRAFTPPAPAARQFGCWLTALQFGWLRGAPRAAHTALDGAAFHLSPVTPPCELLPYHLFAVLALAHAPTTSARADLRRHRYALQAWARRAPDQAGALAELARAVELDCGAGHRALCAYERAAALAQTHGQAWIAALAWEGAAGLAARLALAGAAPGYRRLALAAWRDWGAHGRVQALMQSWPADGRAEHDANADFRAEQARAARAGTVGELGITIAHEVNQPLAAILLHAAAARRWLRRGQPDAARALEALEQISACGRQAGDIIRSVRGLASQEEGASTFPLDPALGEVVQLLRGLLGRQQVQLDIDLQLPDLRLYANRTQLQQVLMNLLLNASEALAGVTGRARRIGVESTLLCGNQVELRVIDNGPGIPPAQRARIFDTLYSTKPRGSGIGLALSRAIVEAHGGRLDFIPVEPHGALFRVVLPLRSGAVLTTSPASHDHA